MTRLPPAIQATLADRMANMGSVREEKRPGRPSEWRLYFGRDAAGKWIRLGSVVVDGVRIPLDERSAHAILHQIRARVADGEALAVVLAALNGRVAAAPTIDVRIAEYVAFFEARVEQGLRSPTSLTAIKRFQRDFFPWWAGKPMDAITTGAVEDWVTFLGAWRNPRGGSLSLKTQKNVRDAFRAFTHWAKRRKYLAEVPHYEAIVPDPHVPDLLTIDDLVSVLAEIPWEKLGLYLAGASHALRLGELRAFTLADYRNGMLRLNKAKQGPQVGARVGKRTKNRAGEWLQLWNPLLVEWCEWRIAQATPEERLRGDSALFWNPDARNDRRVWGPTAAEKWWHRACAKAGARRIKLQEATRHSTLTALGGVLPERLLLRFSRHKDAKSASHYVMSKPEPSAIHAVLGSLAERRTGDGPESPSAVAHVRGTAE
jgi:hypothetical protein